MLIGPPALHQNAYLSEHEVALSELNEHLFSSESIVQLQLEVLDLNFCICQLDQGRLMVGWKNKVRWKGQGKCDAYSAALRTQRNPSPFQKFVYAVLDPFPE